MKSFLSLALLLCVSYAQATIVERDSLLHIYEFLGDLDPASVVIACDIDNTLARTPGILGSDQWFYGMFTYYAQEKGISFDESINQLLPDYFAIHHKISLTPVEPCAPYIVQELQSHGYKVLGLTARSSGIIDRTHEQLAEININFMNTKEVCFTPQDGMLNYPYHYKYGTIYCGNNNKGAVLFRVLHDLGIKPTSIIFIDDKVKNLHTVEAETHKHGIPFVGIHYTRMQEEINTFDPLEGDRLLTAFRQTGQIA